MLKAKIYLIKAALLFCVCIFAVVSSAQQPKYYVNKLQENSGLKTGEIISITKNKAGFLWLATQTKVQQYDGINCVNYPFEEIIDQIFCDDHDDIWVITKQQVFLFNSKLQKFEPKIFSEVGTKKIQTIGALKDNLYFLTPDKIYFKKSGSNSIYPLPNSDFKNAWSSKTPLKSISKFLVYCNIDSVFIYNIQTQKRATIFLPFTDEILPLNDSLVLVGTSRLRSYIVNTNNASIQEITGKINAPFEKGNFLMAYDAAPLSANTNLICTSNGILQYNNLTNSFSILQIFYKGEILYNKKSITVAYKDRENTIYLVSNDGIFMLNQQQSNIVLLRNYVANNISLPNDIRGFSEDNEQNIWMATTEGVVVYNPISEKLRKISLQNKEYTNFQFSTIRQVLIYKNKCYIGTGGYGVFIYDLKSNTINKLLESSKAVNELMAKELSESYVWKITLLQNNLLLIATGKACYTYDTQTKEVLQKKFITPSYNTRTFAQDSLGNIWYGTSQGLVVLDKNFVTKFYIKDSFPDKRIAAFCSISKTKMLVATNGLYEVELKANSSFSINRISEIPNEKFIYCMQKDKEGNIWLGTDDGLIKYAYAAKKVWYFDASDNVQTQAFNSDGAFLHSSGIMYFGGKNGLNIFNPALVSSKNIKLSPSLIRVSFGDTVLCNILSTQTINVPFSKNKIQLYITAPNFIIPFSVKYKYRLNSTEEWTFVGNQSQIYFGSLPSGSYKIDYAASVDEKHWFYASSPVLLVVEKPWWQSNVFLVALSLTLIALVWLTGYWLKKQKEQKNFKLAINYFAKSAFEQNTLNDILWDITSNCVARLGLEECVIYIANQETKTLHQRAAYGNKNPTKFEISNPIIIPFGKGIVGTVANTGKAEIVNNTTLDTRYIVDDANRLSEISVPIIFENQVIGIIDSENHKENFFKAKHLNALTTIASICSAKISNGIATEALMHATEKVEELNREIKEITFLNLRLQMNPHFLFNSLTSIQHLIISKQTNKAYKYLTIFSKFLRSILQFAEETLINLDDEVKLLNMYIALESLGFDESYNYSISVNDEIEQEDFLIPPLLIQPFIENAIWHGLKNKEGNKILRISFDLLNDDSVCCTITDNGVGRKKAEEEKKNNLSENKHQSKAVSVTQKRLQLLQEKTSKPAYLEYIEAGEGTTVKIYFPYFNK